MISQSILITGGTSQVAQALVLEVLSDPDARVLLTSRSSDSIGEIATRPGVLHLPRIDLTKETDLARLAEAADRHFPGRFEVVNAAGQWFTQRPFTEIPLSEAVSLMTANYLTAYGVARHVIPLLVARGGGHFVTFSCDSVNQHYPWMAPYTASKAAVQSLTISIANEFAQYGVIANAIVLSTLFTDRDRRLKPHGDHPHWLQPKEVAVEILNLIVDRVGLLNGNAIKLFRYSDSYFHQAYFDRIRSK
jgi:NAD(P)-dependent dehydrogenase (short-subunit alcohol dehydrogenase family)